MMYSNRIIARIVIEALTPISVGGGEKSIMTDATVLRDVNGLPYIPGTTLSGLIRHELGDQARVIMGYADKKSGEGSRLIFSEAKVVGEDGQAIDGIVSAQSMDTEYWKYLGGVLPVRQHVRINHKGVAEDGGKFDEEIVPKGTRFCFEVEMIADAGEEGEFKDTLSVLGSSTFRIGGGSRSGFGRITVVSAVYRVYDLSNSSDLTAYLEKSSRLDSCFDGAGDLFDAQTESPTEHTMTYVINLKPDDFIFFSSGFGDDNSDRSVVKEAYIEWKDHRPTIVDQEQSLLVPASSVKGAMAHRVAYHYNRLEQRFADAQSEETQEWVGEKNTAVRDLFGAAKGADGRGIRGRVLFSDVLLQKSEHALPKVLNHVKIDRFTGGAVSGALFDEEPLYAKDEKITLEVTILGEPLEGNILGAWEATLDDLCSGMLPLGGGVHRGHGRFHGKWEKH